MKPTDEHLALARAIADTLGETGAPGQAPRARVEQQIAGMAALMGEAWVRRVLAETRHFLGNPTSLFRARKDGQGERSLGGVFFDVARFNGSTAVLAKAISRRTFFATFCWREPTPKTPKAKEPPRPKDARSHRPRHRKGRQKRSRPVQPTIVKRRRMG